VTTKAVSTIQYLNIPWDIIRSVCKLELIKQGGVSKNFFEMYLHYETNGLKN
jgi:hypothetical protein